jgi:hypothetical protein
MLARMLEPGAAMDAGLKRSPNGATFGRESMSFGQDLVLQLVSPLLGTALIGGVAALIARNAQDRPAWSPDSDGLRLTCQQHRR